MTHREIPLDAETVRLLDLTRDKVAFPPWRLVFGDRIASTVRLALAFAVKHGIEPDPAFQPVYDANWHYIQKIHLDTAGLLEDRKAAEVGGILRASLSRYVGESAPDGRRLADRNGEPIDLTESTMRKIAARAFAHRKTAIEEGSDLIDAAMSRILSFLPNPEEQTREVLFKPEPKLYSDLRIRVMDLGWNLDALLEIQVNRQIEEEELAEAGREVPPKVAAAERATKGRQEARAKVLDRSLTGEGRYDMPAGENP